MESHPPSDVLRRFARGQADVADARAALPHLLRACPACRSALVAALAPAPPREYGRGIRRAYRAVKRLLRVDEKGSERAVGTLRASLDEESQAIADRVRDLAGPALVRALLEETTRLLADDPLLASRVAYAARLAAEGMNEALYGRALISDWEALACAEYGNALRAADRLQHAEIVFREALLVLPQGTGNKAVEARVYALLASLYGTQRLFVQAEGASAHAITTYLSLGDRHTAGQEVITKALYMFYAGRAEQALAENERGLALLEPEREPRLEALARYNAIRFMVTLGRFPEAEVALFRARAVLLPVFGRVDLVKLRWLEAQIDAGKQRLERAEKTFGEVRAELLTLEMGFHAALATLDLAHVCVEQEEWQRAETYAREAGAMFSALGVDREMLAAVLVLVRCVERRGQQDYTDKLIPFIYEPTLLKAMAQKVVAFVRRAEHDPTARF